VTQNIAATSRWIKRMTSRLKKRYSAPKSGDLSKSGILAKRPNGGARGVFRSPVKGRPLLVAFGAISRADNFSVALSQLRSPIEAKLH
jgi:hypothetical protein